MKKNTSKKKFQFFSKIKNTLELKKKLEIVFFHTCIKKKGGDGSQTYM
jgi:hypothetical protein